MMLSGCGYPHGTAGNRSEREINPLQVSDLEWLARTGQCGVIDLALLAFHIKWNDQLGGAYAFLSGWNAEIPVIPFLLDDFSYSKPTEFHFIYSVDGIKYW